MRFPGSAPGVTAAMDFLPGRTRVVAAFKTAAGGWSVCGTGEASLTGVDAGRVTHLSDAAEMVAGALAAAEKSCGRKITTLFYTFHDDSAFFRKIRASRILPGEGQIRTADVRAVFASAQRLAVDFETVHLYSAGLGFVIDDQDPVENPVGIFGRKIEMEAGFLCVSASALTRWRDVMRRAYAPVSWAVPLLYSAVTGCVEEDATPKKRLVLFARGEGFGHCRATGRRLESYHWSAEEAQSIPALNGSASGVDEIWVTGEGAAQTASRLASQTGVSVRAALPAGLEGLVAPEDVPTAGLLAIAAERERQKISATTRGQGLARKARRTLTHFWNEYF